METTEEQQYAQATACAFTGHRPTRFTFKHDEAHPDCIELKKVLSKQIDFLYHHGVTDFYTGCALGVDMWAGEAVLSAHGAASRSETALYRPLCRTGKEMDRRAAGALSCNAAQE